MLIVRRVAVSNAGGLQTILRADGDGVAASVINVGAGPLRVFSEDAAATTDPNYAEYDTGQGFEADLAGGEAVVAHAPGVDTTVEIVTNRARR